MVAHGAGAQRAVTVQAWRRAWALTTRVVLVVGGLVPLALWAAVSPWSLAVCLAAGWLAWRVGGRKRSVDHLGGLWRRHLGELVPDPAGLLVLRLLPAFLLAALGWNTLLGGTGTAIVLVDALFGLLLLLVGHAAAVVPPAEMIDEPGPGTSVELVTGLQDPEDEEAGYAGWSGPRTLLADLTDAELWHAWRASSRALNLEQSLPARLRIVSARSRYLDALAERDPEGMARRLAAGAASDWTSFDFPA